MRLLFLALLVQCLYSQSLESIIEDAIEKNTKIKTLEQEIEKLQYEARIATKWENPIISSGFNTFYPLNPTFRGDPMQTISVSISQKIDLFGKKTIEGQKILLDRQIKILELQALKKEIIKQIKITMIKNYEIKQQEKILKKTLKNLAFLNQQANTPSSELPTQEVYKIQILQAKIKIKLNQISENQKNQMINLDEISFGKNEDINFSKKFQTSFAPDYYKNSYVLKIQKLKEERDMQDIRLAKRSFLSDPSIGVSYAYREKQDDFLSFNISFSLPIYGKEKLMIENTKTQLKITQSTSLSIENEVKSKIKRFQNIIISKQKELDLIENTLIPQSKKLISLYSKNIANSSSAIKDYYTSINDLLEIEILKTEVLSNIFIAFAELESIGDAQ
ncbi:MULTISPECIES: TolC family protein [unclassified Helicobacter]|uniref:TolC family protein n=1 Tax=unclassified Helicobacter TaxID=2593540 RepID=UPI000CF1918A|nr:MULTISPECIES: TolC family protein [unclassified Helicobacter]